MDLLSSVDIATVLGVGGDAEGLIRADCALGGSDLLGTDALQRNAYIYWEEDDERDDGKGKKV